MSSWFDPYKKIIIRKDNDGNIIEESYKFDSDLYLKTQDEINYIDKNKGKFVKVVEDFDDEPLKETEIKYLEENSELRRPYIIMEEEKTITKQVHHIVKQATRTYKPKRKILSNNEREAVKKIYDNCCNKCGKTNANQIHHINGNPSNNKIGNLELLCYDCHLNMHKKAIE